MKRHHFMITFTSGTRLFKTIKTELRIVATGNGYLGEEEWSYAYWTETCRECWWRWLKTL